MGSMGPLSAAGLGPSVALAQLQTTAALDTPGISATSLPAMPDLTNATACAFGAGS